MDARDVVVTQEAQYQLVRIPSNADYNEVKRMLRALGIIADAGSVYDPAYEAAKPPVECRVVYALSLIHI